MRKIIGTAIDCSTELTQATAHSFYTNDHDVAVIRYLGKQSLGLAKATNPIEVRICCREGLKIISVFETNQTHVDAFNYSNGVLEAAQAVNDAKWIQQPARKPIYFPVDYDAQPEDYGAIAQYFKGVVKSIAPYTIGFYGKEEICRYLIQQGIPIMYHWEPSAWSGGIIADTACMFQYNENVNLHGVNVDLNHIYSDPGWWTVDVSWQLGDNGTEVENIQIMLNTYGYGLKVDGDYGPVTASKVKEFQTKVGLPDTGVVDQNTLDALNGKPVLPKDIKSGWTGFTDDCMWAFENGLLGHYSDNTFRPTDPITREQASFALHQLVKKLSNNQIKS